MNTKLAARFAALLLAVALAGAAFAQGPTGLPSLPPGDASIVGVVRGPDGPVAGIEVALYALTSQGHPGIGGTQTDAMGVFRFEAIANDPQISYLLGARFRGIPFSQRLRFEPGQTQLDVEVAVSNPTADASAVEIVSSRLRIDWAGSRLGVTETHVLRNPTQRVIYVQPDERTGAKPFVVSEVPADASDFTRLPIGTDSDLALRNGRVEYWGPFFPGDQELDFQYLLPADRGDVLAEVAFPSGTGEFAIAVPKTGPGVRAESLAAGEAIELDGIAYETFERDDVAEGERVAFTIELPELREDPDALALPRTDLFLELDDVALVVNQEVTLEVSPGAPLVSAAGEPLLRLELPPGAQLTGLSRDAASIGAAGGAGQVVVAGPVPPGTTRFGFRYALPVESAGAKLALAFPVAVGTLRIHIADTGDLVVSSDRLHRLRPVRQGTRTYLQREAFNVEAGERVNLSLARPVKTPLPRSAVMGLMLVAGAAACFFLVRPLQTRSDDDAPDAVEEQVSRERAIVYATIHDLDHDYETGKIAEADYHSMREELRETAIDLLRRERAPQPAARPLRAAPPPAPAASPARFCTQCGEPLDPAWRFCAGCGAAIAGPRGPVAASDD